MNMTYCSCFTGRRSQSKASFYYRLFYLSCSVFFVLFLLLSGCAQESIDPATQKLSPTPEDIPAQISRYDFANRCCIIEFQSNNKFLATNSNRYTAEEIDPAKSTPFFMKPSALGVYILYDNDGGYLDIGLDGFAARSGKPYDTTRFELESVGTDTFVLRSVKYGKLLGIKTDGNWLLLKNKLDETCIVKFHACLNCREFPESEVNASVAISRPAVGEKIIGFADAHCHIAGSEGFGGKVIWGKIFHPLGITWALPDSKELHGDSGSKDLICNVATGKSRYDTSGWPDFRQWPGADMPTHQTVYYRWLERAYLGGLKLIVNFAVSNKVLCQLAGHAQGYSCDDMEAVDRQLKHTRDLEAYIDAQCGGPGKGWFRIVTSPAEARQVISEGKLAVILGIEVATIFGAATDDLGQKKYIEDQLDYYYDKGVRSIFPMHGFNNGFGGTAMFVPIIYNLGNRIIRGEYLEPCNCPEPGDPSLPPDEALAQGEIINYKEPSISYADNPLMGLLAPAAGWILPFYPQDMSSHCNTQGLTGLGEYFIRELMDRKMILEIDHMSWKMLNRVLDIAEENSYPVVSSHTAPVEGKGNEFSKSIRQIERIRDLGGIVTPILQQGNGSIWDDRVQGPDCTTTSKSWAQSYLYFAEIMKKGVPLSTDFNGFATMPSPRFGVNGCSGNAEQCARQKNPVEYPFAAHTGQGTFDRLRTGNRVFDINTDGMACMGLLPDFIQDLKQVGLTDQDLEPLFNSAEAYIEMWEHIEGLSGKNE